ncbi:C4-dicarboxylate ABC transporter substrate-binding protein [Mesorhizobium tianshanense]|uniref:Tripartite ATP-independent transporter DctP family solute receptor n=1 Tax=Mesorhizobium tianshanense TaxID=39844 RepID=A0A562P365_9HYPH|nr:DctP family TRAP transporter solute-binding subunit [Mesorhizobium tianshanense]TWI38436.1 tripartite ATP-independent transporter DctP family solute receptor [Mesorhizobium tianshanense]GLS38588.1 C4-dicarboxylate ABC transporter substrate-binding protein [Mesorhizobium tianshanense]
MNRRAFFVACMLAAGLPSSLALAEPEMTLNLGYVGGVQAPEAIAMGQFAEEVLKGTGGRIAIRLQGGGALGGDREVVEGVQVGTVDMTVVSTSIVANFAPELKVFDIPFLFRDFDHAEAVLNGPIGDKTLEGLPSNGLVGLAFGGMGFRQLTNNVRAVKEPSDVEGLKIRTQQNEMHIAVWTELDVLPTPMAIPEVYTALQQGVVDGQENPIGAIINNRFGEVQKYLSLTDHAFTPLVLLISPAVHGGLSDADKAVFKEAAHNAMARNRKEVEAVARTGIETLTGQGMTVVEDVNKEAFRAKLDPLFAKFADEFGEAQLKAIQETK